MQNSESPNFQNYDPNELEKFAKIAAHWWDPAGEVGTLHAINPLRLGYIEKKAPLNHSKVIDIGCGGGILTESMSQKGAIVTGIDLNASLIEVAKLHQLESKTTVEYLKISAEAIALERPESYDVVTCLEMLEHVPDPQSIVKSAVALLKPGGHLFFSTLNRNLKSYVFAILGAEYILKLLPINTHHYAQFIKPSELSQWMRASHCSPDDIIGIKYNPFTKHFSLTPDVSVNYLIYGRKN